MASDALNLRAHSASFSLFDLFEGQSLLSLGCLLLIISTNLSHQRMTPYLNYRNIVLLLRIVFTLPRIVSHKILVYTSFSVRPCLCLVIFIYMQLYCASR